MLRGMFRMTRFLLAASALLAVSACKHHPPAPPPPPFQRIVVATLPLDNATPSIDAPIVFRAKIHPLLARKGYLLQPLNQTDEVLRGMGIQLGGQIKGVDPKELRTKLGVDYTLWGTVKEASSLVTGVYNRRKVEVELILTDVRSGEVVWKDTRSFATDGAANLSGKNALGNVLGGVVDGAVRSNMANEHQQLANQMANVMPWCPREPPPPPSPPPPLPQAEGASGTHKAPAE